MVSRKPSDRPDDSPGSRRRAPRRLGPGASFLQSALLVLAVMVAAGLAEHLYETILVPRGTLEQGWFKGLLGAWALVLGGGVLAYRRWLYLTFSSVRTSVVILTAFTLSCIAGSFVLQQRDLDTRGLTGEKAYEAFRLAEAGFMYTLVHGRSVEIPMRPQAKKFFDTLRERFGDEFASERTELFHKMMGGRTVDQSVKEFAERHDESFRSLWWFCRITRLADMHRSWWFVALMAMLSISLACGTVKRFRPKASEVGFVMTHGGFLVLMVGFALSMAGEERGMLRMNVGETHDQFIEFNSRRRMRLPFKVTLEDFYTHFHDEIFLQWLDVDHEAEQFPGPVQRGVKVDAGREYPLWGGKYQVDVLEVAEYGNTQATVVDRQDGRPLNPAVSIDVSSDGGMGANGWLFAGTGAQSFYQDPEGKFVLSFHFEDPQVANPPKSGVWGDLLLHAEGHETARVPAVPGTTFEFAGRSFELKKVAPDFARRDAPLEAQQVRNPAVLLAVQGEDDEAPQMRWNFAWIDFDKLHEPPHPDIRIRYTFRSGKQDPTKVYRVHGSRAGEAVELELVRFQPDGTPSRAPLKLGEPIALAGEDLVLRLGQLFTRAALEYPVTPLFESSLLAADRLAESEGKVDPHDHTGHDHGKGGHDHEDHSGHNHAPGEHPRVGLETPDWDSILGHRSPSMARKFAPPGPLAAKLRITHPGGDPVERWFLSDHPEAGRWQDGTLSLVLGSNRNKVKEWRSLLVASDGETTRRQMIRVNHPMVFAGWTMYQTDANLEDPTYSGIQVLYDPGWYFIEPGLILVCFGVIFMFWIKPWMRQDQSGGSKAKGARA